MRNTTYGTTIAAITLCAGSSATAQCGLATSLAGFKNTPDGGTAFFDVAVALRPIEIDLLLMNVSTTAGTPFHIEVFTTPTTFQGKELDPTQWTRRAGGDGQSSGQGRSSDVFLANRIVLDANSSQGMAIVITGAGHRYENGNGTNEFYENRFLNIRTGAVTFGAFGTSAFRPRVWNGAIFYQSPTCTCPHACDFDTNQLCICDIFDFLEFQNTFVSGDPCACDKDISTGVGVCDIFDFLAFQDEFVKGCP
jgi:hypothetical protein